MTLFLIFAVAILIVLMCYQYLPVNDPDLPKYRRDVASVEYVLNNPDLLISKLGFSSAGNWREKDTVKYDCVIPIDLYTYPNNVIQGYFIDISGENGYLIVDADNNLYQYQVTGDYQQLRDAEDIIFSPYDGLMYTYKKKVHLVTGSAQAIPDLKERYTAYIGQKSAGDGDIIQPQSYISARYGPEYSIFYSGSLANFNYVSQGDTTIYYRGRGSRSEGNCTLTAIYNALNYISTTSARGSLPVSYETALIDAKKDAFYSKYASNPTYVIDTPKVLPALYADIRAYAIEAHSYEVEALTQLQVEDVINHMLTAYGSPVEAKNNYSASYSRQVLDTISQGLPVLNNVTLSTTYGSHSMVVTGYQIYQSSRDIEELHELKFILLLQVADGWANSARYYDANQNMKLEVVTVFSNK